MGASRKAGVIEARRVRKNPEPVRLKKQAEFVATVYDANGLQLLYTRTQNLAELAPIADEQYPTWGTIIVTENYEAVSMSDGFMSVERLVSIIRRNGDTVTTFVCPRRTK